jgi:hypothetical protein
MWGSIRVKIDGINRNPIKGIIILCVSAPLRERSSERTWEAEDEKNQQLPNKENHHSLRLSASARKK